MTEAGSGWLRGIAFVALALAVAFGWDVVYGLSYDHVAVLRRTPFFLSYFVVPMALCAAAALVLRRWLSLDAGESGLLAAGLGSFLAPFIVFLPVLYFDCAVLQACL